MSKYLNSELNEKSYSFMGKISLQKYPIILQKDKIIKGTTKKYKTKDLFTPDEPKKNDKIKEYFSLYSNYEITTKGNKNSPKKKKSKVEFVCKLMKDNPKLKYHNRHLYTENKKRLAIEADTFSYAPKYDYIRPRLLSGPCWKNTKEKNIVDKRNYYITHKDFLKSPDTKCLVNMNRTTKRGEFIDGKNIRIRNEKLYENIKLKENDKNNNNIKNIPLFINLSDKNKVNKNKIIKTERNKKKNISDNNNEVSNSNDLFSKTYNNFNTKLNNKKSIFDKEKNELNKENINISLYNNNLSNINKNKTTLYSLIKKNNNSNIMKNHAPDFNKIMSREKIEQIKENKLHKIPFIIPNYTLVRERTLSMTIYKKLSKNKKMNKFEGIDYTIDFDPDKFINKYNNHISLRGPNFNSMLSRVYSVKKNALPSFMNNIYDRGSINRITEKALKMNKFKASKMPTASTSFMPKKSFNRIINLNLINSHDFKENINDEFINEIKEKLKNEIERKNKEDEIEYLKDLGLLSQFDSFTCKTIPVEKHNSQNKNQKNGIYKTLKNLFLDCE